MNMEAFQVAFQVLLMVVLSAVVDKASGQSFHMGSCPVPPVQQNFNVSRYMGTWYEIEKLPAVFERGTCHQATYTLLSDGTVNVRNAELLSSGQVNAIEAVAKVENTSQPAILAVSFFKGVPDSPYWVLSTDYLTSSLVYSCFDYLTLFHIDYAWILARTRALPDHVVRQQHDKLAAAGIRTDRLTVSNQTGCDALP